jgi:hypothetical protein
MKVYGTAKGQGVPQRRQHPEARRPGADEAWPYVEEIWKKSPARIQAPTLIRGRRTTR